MLPNCKQKEWLLKFKRIELWVPPSKPKSTEGFPFEFELGKKMV